jgi:hypothetical protein
VCVVGARERAHERAKGGGRCEGSGEHGRARPRLRQREGVGREGV